MSTFGELIYFLFPAASLFLATSSFCRPKPYVWIPPGWLFGIVWTFLAVTTGLAGIDVFRINDLEATSLFFGVCWLLGSGWTVANRFCSQTGNLIYGVLTFVAVYYLYTSIKNATTGTEKQRQNGSTLVLPLLAWVGFAVFLYLYSWLGQYITAFQITIDETELKVLDPALCRQCQLLDKK